MPRFKTTFNGYAAKFSPFVENRLAVATAQNFGIIGNGRLHILEVSEPRYVYALATYLHSKPDTTLCPLCCRTTHTHAQLTPNGLVETAVFDTADGLYDCAWSEENENVVLAASGDGSVKVYDLAAPPMANPLRVYREHKHEVCRGDSPGYIASSNCVGALCLPSRRLTHLCGCAVLCCAVLLPELEHAAAGPVSEQQLGRQHKTVLDTQPRLHADIPGALLLCIPCRLVRVQEPEQHSRQ
jgi:hypothetical protein